MREISSANKAMLVENVLCEYWNEIIIVLESAMYLSAVSFIYLSICGSIIGERWV